MEKSCMQAVKHSCTTVFNMVLQDILKNTMVLPWYKSKNHVTIVLLVLVPEAAFAIRRPVAKNQSEAPQ